MYKISANIVCNNEKHWIKESILSIVNLVDEIVFVDDRSTDGTLEIVKDLSKSYSNIKIFEYNQHNLKNLGDLKNYALSKSTNEFVIRWDADFISYNDIETLFQFCETNKDIYDGYILSGPNLGGDVYHQPKDKQFFGPECYLFKKDKSRFKQNERYPDYPNFDKGFKFCYPQNTNLGKDFFFLHTNTLKSIEKIAYRKRMTEYQISGFEGTYWEWISNDKLNAEDIRKLEIQRTKESTLSLIDFDFNKWGEHPNILKESESIKRFKIKKSGTDYYIDEYPY